MYFEQFTLQRKEQWHTGFIRSVTHQGYKNSAHLLYCEFDTASFSDQYFADYGVDFPDEIKGSVLKRKAEFLAGRIVVKQALMALGLSVTQQQVSIAKDRSPVWPAGVRGSISHTTDFAVCCVASAARSTFIGVDSELILSDSAAQSLAVQIHDTDELKLLTDAGLSAALATSLIFSAKESLFKALYPVVCCFFGFEKARVTRLDLQRSSLTLSLCGVFIAPYGLKPDHTIQFSIKGTLVHTLLMQ